MQKNKGFTLVELIVVLVILAILVAITISGIYLWVGRARYNTDVHNASTINDSVYALSEDPLVKEWAAQSDNSQLIIWSFSHLGKAKGSIWFGGKEELDNYTSWYAVISRSLTDSANIISAEHYNGSYTDYEDNYPGYVLPQSKTGDGFVLFMERDGNGTAIFHCYALCTLSSEEIETLLTKYNIPDKYANKLRELT